jgi:hypothetical protein
LLEEGEGAAEDEHAEEGAAGEEDHAEEGAAGAAAEASTPPRVPPASTT